MEIKHIEMFLNLAQTLNFSKTASQMHISQPAVTKIIKNIENELGVSLFKRNKREVSLTANGKIFYLRMQRMINSYYSSVEETREAFNTEKRSLLIGFTNIPIEHYCLPRIIHKFHNDYPDIQIYLENLNHNTLKQRLQSKDNDLIFTTKDDLVGFENISFQPLSSGKFYVWLPYDHPLTNKKVLHLSDLVNQNIILMDNNWAGFEQIELQDMLKKNNHSINISYTNNVQTVSMIVKAGLSISVMPAILADKNDKMIKLVPLDYKVKISYGAAYNNANKPAIKLFVNYLKKNNIFDIN